MTYKFDNDVAIITGGAMGIGLACAQRLSSLGTKIILWDKNKPDGTPITVPPFDRVFSSFSSASSKIGLI